MVKRVSKIRDAFDKIDRRGMAELLSNESRPAACQTITRDNVDFCPVCGRAYGANLYRHKCSQEDLSELEKAEADAERDAQAEEDEEEEGRDG